MGTRPLDAEKAKEAADAWMKLGFSRTKAAALLGIPVPTFQHRLEAALRYGLLKTTDTNSNNDYEQTYPQRLAATVKNGFVVIGSDCHYWPGLVSTAHKAFLKIIQTLKPEIVILNGDVLDGASVSRFNPIGWEKKPFLADEVEACRDRTREIEEICGKAKKFWTIGNHDIRLETRLASIAPEYAKMHGVKLKDHFPRWQHCWSLWINNDVVVKHRFKGGIHAVHNNVMWAGKTIVTGHLHSLKIAPFTDYNGTRYGIDSGSLAEPYGPQFGYTEDNPVNWRSGFVVLSFKDGELILPELVHVYGKKYEFRGKLFSL